MPVTDPHRPRGFRAELADAVSPKAIGLIAGVLLLQLGFILSYIGAFHSPSPHRVRVVVAAPASAQQSIITQLNGLAGEPVRAVATTGADAARAAAQSVKSASEALTHQTNQLRGQIDGFLGKIRAA